MKRILLGILLLSTMFLFLSCSKSVQPKIPKTDLSVTEIELDDAWLNFINGNLNDADKDMITKGIESFLTANYKGSCVKNEELVDSFEANIMLGCCNDDDFSEELPRVCFEKYIVENIEEDAVAEYNVIFQKHNDISEENSSFYMIILLIK